MPRPVLLLAALLLASPAWAACPIGQAPMLNTRLYFGLTENGKRIADAAWDDFLTRSVTPRFPAGYTVTDATGRWRDQKTNVTSREPSRIVEIDAPDTKQLRDRLEEIRKDYGVRFHQQSVGIVTLAACGAF